MIKWTIVLMTVALVAIHALLGAAATLCLGLMFILIWFCRDMVWAAERRNDRERLEFAQVNNGHAEPDPDFLVRVWS